MFECAIILLGPSFVYCGKMISRLGGIYHSLVESVFAKAYLGGNDALRKLLTMRLNMGVKFRNVEFCKAFDWANGLIDYGESVKNFATTDEEAQFWAW